LKFGRRVRKRKKACNELQAFSFTKCAETDLYIEDTAVCVEYLCRTLNFLKVGFMFSKKKIYYTNSLIKMTNWAKTRVN
jgi:hypothetical protein